MAIAISTLSLSTGSREDFPGEDLSLIGMFLAFDFFRIEHCLLQAARSDADIVGGCAELAGVLSHAAP
jgi:hypothetical protein